MPQETTTTQAEKPAYRRHYRPTGLAELLPLSLKPALRQQGFWHSDIALHWPQIVGPVYAQHSVPRQLKFPHEQRQGGVLTVATTGTMAAMMQHSVLVILDRINTYFGYNAVSGVRFQQVSQEYLTTLLTRAAGRA